jgi:hypothetical protein
VEDSSDYAGNRKAAFGLGQAKLLERLPKVLCSRRARPKSRNEVVGIESLERSIARYELLVRQPIQPRSTCHFTR